MRRLAWRWALLLVGCLPLVALAGNVGVRVTPLPGAPAHMPMPPSAGAADAAVSRRVWLAAPGQNSAWYAINLDRDWRGTSVPLLVVGSSDFATVKVFLPPDYRPRLLAASDPALDAAFSHRALVSRLPMGLRADQPVYLQFEVSSLHLPCWVGITDAASYHADDLGFVRASTFFASVQAATVLVILCFLIVLRDRSLLFFVVYASALLLYCMSMTGELFAGEIGQIFGPVGYGVAASMSSVTGVFAIWFALEFAELRRYTPRLARWLGALRWPLAVAAILAWVPSWTFLLAPRVNWLLAAGALLILLTTSLSWRRGSRQAGFFLLSWVPLLLLTVVRVLQIAIHMPLPAWLEYGFPASMAWADVIIAVGLADRMLQARRERDQAAHLAQFDPLTGVLNRRAITAWLHAAWSDETSEPTPLAVLFLDIDHFKQVNDQHGHAAGDACLTAVTEAIRKQIADSDRVGRYGGEEFVVVLAGDSVAYAQQRAERIRAGVAALRVRTDAQVLALTVSIGVAVRDADTDSADALVKMADSAQYHAKSEGRDRIVVYRPDLPEGAFAR